MKQFGFFYCRESILIVGVILGCEKIPYKFLRKTKGRRGEVIKDNQIIRKEENPMLKRRILILTFTLLAGMAMTA
jgi:hypothetical protein